VVVRAACSILLTRCRRNRLLTFSVILRNFRPPAPGYLCNPHLPCRPGTNSRTPLHWSYRCHPCSCWEPQSRRSLPQQCRKLRDSVGPRSNAIQRRLAERPSKRGPTNPGNHQTVVSSVGERTSNGCQRRFDGDVGFGCSRNAPPTALERRSRWNAGIKVCDKGGL
jgi:hypothetical protein